MKLPRLQFSLRTLLIVVTLLALPMGWFTNRLRQAERQRDAVAKLRAMGFRVEYDWYERAGAFHHREGGKPQTTLLRKLLGDDFFDHVTRVSGYDIETIASEKDIATALPCLVSLTDLESLDLSGSQAIDDNFVMHLTSLTKLQSLGLENTNVTNDGLACLRAMPELQSLNLRVSPVTDAGFVHLQSLQQLKLLSLANYFTDPTISGEHLEDLNKLVRLQELRLSGSKVRIADLGKLRLPRLTTLRVGDLVDDGKPVSPHLFAGLPELATLHILNVANPPGLMEAIAGCSKLESLDLSEASITDGDLAQFARLQKLRELKLSGTRISDAGLPALARLDLEFVDLQRTKISDDGLRLLAHFPTLTRVAVDKPNCGTLSSEAFGDLKRAVPKLRILYATGFAGPLEAFELPAGDTQGASP